MRRLWVCVCLVLGMNWAAWAQETSRKVAVTPFAVHGQQDTARIQKTILELLVRQLGSESIKAVEAGGAAGNEADGRAAARKLGADYVVVGSYNEIGTVISLDARLVDVSGAKKTETLFAEEKGVENLASATNQLVQQMAVHLMAKAIVAEIKIRGNDRIEADAIKVNLKSKKGELLKPDVVAEDIKSIYKMGFFEKVEANVEDMPMGKVLTFDVQENPSIQEVKIKGNKKLKEKDILAAIATRQYTILQKNIISDDAQKILKLYHQKGFFNAVVNTSIDFPKEPRKAVVTFDIQEKGKVYIQEIAFRGNKSFSARKLRGIMQVKEKTFLLSWITDRGILQKDILESDVDRLTVFYHDQGFMDAKVGTPEVESKADGFHISIPVEEGNRYKVTGVAVKGDLLEGMDKDKIDKGLESKKDEFFSREDLRDDMAYLSKTYMDQGFAHVEVSPDVKRNPENRTTDITFNIDKKDKVKIGRIFVSGNTKTRDKVIRREMKLAEGDTFSSTQLEKSLTNLKKLDYFEEVEIVPSETGQPGVMDLNVKVKEKLTGAISVGGGFASDDGLFATGEITQRNLFGRGQTLGLKAYFGQEAQRYVLSFTEPWLLDYHISAGIDVYNWLREYSDFTKDAAGVRLRSGYAFGNYSRFNAFYTYEDADVTDVAEDASLIIKDQEGRQVKSSVTFGVERDTTDHPFVPTKGSLNSVTLEYSTPYLGSDSDFLKMEVSSGWFIPIYWKLVGFVRGQFGYIEELDDTRPVPIYERFFLGGINSLRGWKWGDVGPTDPETGDVIGGLTYAVATAEVLFPLIEKLGVRGVVFFDAGNAYNTIDEMDISSFRTDVGGGVRWNSPFGPLRLEIGYNLDPEPDEDQVQWQFSAGAYF